MSAPLPYSASIRVALPGGVWLDEVGGGESGAPQRHVLLRGLTDADELALLDGMSRPPGERALDLLARCLEDGERIGPALSVGDREAALLHLRHVTIGDTLEAVLTCPVESCRARLEISHPVTGLLVEPYPEVKRLHDLAVNTADGCYAVTFRLATTGDLAEAAPLALVDPDRAARRVFAACVVTARLDEHNLSSEALPAAVRAAVAQAMSEHDPQAEIVWTVECPECAGAFSVVFDVASFLLRELDDRASRLVRDIHVLATHYHWSEQDILALPPSRRARYLELVADANSRAHTS